MNQVALLDRFAGIGGRDEDDAQSLIFKRTFVLATALYAILGVAWGSVYLALGLAGPALVPYVYVIFAAFVLALFTRTGSLVVARRAVLVAWLLLPLVLQLTMGGFASASAVVLWSVAAPLGALIFAPSESPWWTAGFVFVLVGAWLADPLLHPEVIPGPGTVRVFFALNLGGVGVAMFFVLRDFLVRLQDTQVELQREQERSERLLLNMLPGQIAGRLKDGEEAIADRLEEVTIVFSDLVGFTQMSQRLSASEVVSVLADLVADFDRLARKHGLEKIRTQGDAYMAVAGAPEPRPDHVEAAAMMALDMLQTAHRHLDPSGSSLELRIGIDCGPVVAGVIGLDKFVYDVWGDTVNTASRMESHGLPGLIHVTPSVYERLRHEFVFEGRGTIDVKGKGPMSTYFLLRRRARQETASSEERLSDVPPGIGAPEK